jgi:CRP-like cAMP-binding protein
LTELVQIERVVFLHSADLFASCRAEEVLRIAAIAHERRFGAGSSIYKVSEPATALFLVVRGGVKLDGGNREPRSVGPLGAFGVEDILCGRLRSRNATAETDTLTLAIETEDFFDLLSNNIEIVRALFRRYVQRD